MSEFAILMGCGIAGAAAILIVIADYITKPDPESESWES